MNNNSFYKLIILTIVFLFLVLLPGCVGREPTLVVITKVKTTNQGLSTPIEKTVPPTMSETPEPTRTEASTPTSTLSNTATSTSTTISTNTPTFTPEPALLTLNQDTACFYGPSLGQDLIAYINAGSRYPILATIQDQSWWFVSLEEEKNCWIFGDYATTQGVDNNLPIITPSTPPTSKASIPSASHGIYYMLILKDTGGPFGCGDSLIKFYPGVDVKGSTEDEILAALNALFSNHNQYVDGLYNPIYQSQLKAKGVDFVGGDVVVRLGGTFVRPTDNCESQRMHDQIWWTISQFSSTRAVIYLNNALLGDLLVVTNK